MNTFLIASAFIVIGFLGLSATVNAETKALTPVSVQKDAPTADLSQSKSSADDYYFQSWNCLTDL